ncbi:hypothetical protein TeGR_g14351, partial [Tetraparma gracilis]
MRHTFIVQHASLLQDCHGKGLDQQLYVSGGCEALGHWDEEMAVGPMELDESYETPTYRLNVRDLPDNPIKYKYLIKRGNVITSWETIPPPFRIITPDSVSRAAAASPP